MEGLSNIMYSGFHPVLGAADLGPEIQGPTDFCSSYYCVMSVQSVLQLGDFARSVSLPAGCWCPLAPS